VRPEFTSQTGSLFSPFNSVVSNEAAYRL